MTDASKTVPTTNEQSTTSSPAINDTKPKGSSAKGTTKAKAKGKARRARPRRRGADPDDDEDAESGSDNSLTSASDASDSEEEEDNDEPASKSVPGSSKSGAARPSAVFADVSSTTPAAWADEKPGEAEEISFDDFNRGESTRGAKRGRGRGRGGIIGDAAPREKKVFTEEQTRKYEEKKAKLKAKKLALREAKRREQEEAKKSVARGGDEPSKEAVKGDAEAGAEGSAKATQSEQKEPKKRKPKAKKDTPNPTAGDTLAASTASLSLADTSDQASTPAQTSQTAKAIAETPASADSAKRPPTSPRANNRESRLRNDPKITPRNGNFWTHDQRQPEAGPSDDGFRQGGFRGRGMANGVRGGIRGRGRGAFAPGQFGPPRGGYGNYGSRGQELTSTEDTASGSGEKDKTLEMDKLEAELERQKDRQREAKEAKAAKEAQPSAGEDGGSVDQAEVKPAPAKESKWGHEGFESQQAVQQFQANRAFGGRGRGRASFPRGSYISRLPFHPANLRNNAPPRPSPLHVPAAPTENNSTQPDSAALMDASEEPKVKLPGTEAKTDATEPVDTAVTAQPTSSTTLAGQTADSTTTVSGPAPTFASIRANAPTFVQQPQPTHQPQAVPFVPSAFSDGTQSPQPFLGPGSENGSTASNGAFPPAFVPAAPLAVNHTGEYYPNPTQQQPFYPRRPFPQQAQIQPQPFYPQSYSPDFFQQQHQHPSRHGSFSSQGYVDGRASPYPQGGTYTPGGPGTAFFMPARPSKISIRNPIAGQTGQSEDDGLKRYPSIDHPAGRPADGMDGMNGDMHGMDPQGYYAQQYNPYAAAQMGYGGPNGMNGMNGMGGMNGMNGQGWVAGGAGYPNGEYGYEYGY